MPFYIIQSIPVHQFRFCTYKVFWRRLSLSFWILILCCSLLPPKSVWIFCCWTGLTDILCSLSNILYLVELRLPTKAWARQNIVILNEHNLNLEWIWLIIKQNNDFFLATNRITYETIKFPLISLERDITIRLREGQSEQTNFLLSAFTR